MAGTHNVAEAHHKFQQKTINEEFKNSLINYGRGELLKVLKDYVPHVAGGERTELTPSQKALEAKIEAKKAQAVKETYDMMPKKHKENIHNQAMKLLAVQEQANNAHLNNGVNPLTPYAQIIAGLNGINRPGSQQDGTSSRHSLSGNGGSSQSRHSLSGNGRSSQSRHSSREASASAFERAASRAQSDQDNLEAAVSSGRPASEIKRLSHISRKSTEDAASKAKTPEEKKKASGLIARFKRMFGSIKRRLSHLVYLATGGRFGKKRVKKPTAPSKKTTKVSHKEPSGFVPSY
jgi:hypothetical protein